jgi:5-methylcytosine-specific restriction endonuclease McrA
MSKDVSKLKDKLMTLVKNHAKQRDGYVDQRSGELLEGSNAHASHVIPVSQGNRLAFDPRNIKTLSMHNHLHWWHKNPTVAGQWYRDTFPDNWKYLESHMEDDVHWKLFNWQEMYELAKAGKWDEYQEYIQTH